MTKSRGPRQPGSIPVSPLLQQMMALLVIALGAITLLAVFGVADGRWVNAWVDLLRYLAGWGIYPVGASIVLAGLLWLQYLLDQSVLWRWRPCVGAELVFFSLLGLTHVILGGGDPWALVEHSAGGGLLGWGISVHLLTYLGWLPAVVVLGAFLTVGLALAFDVTTDDLRQTMEVVQVGIAAYRAQRARKRTIRESTVPPERRPTSAIDPNGTNPPQSPSPSSQSMVKRRTAERRRQSALPPISLLDESEGPPLTDQQVRRKARIIKETLAQFGLPVEVVEVRMGPAVTQFGVEPGFVERAGSSERKVRVKQISQRSDDLALALATPRLRVEAPVPGRPFVGIEVPNEEIQVVSVREVLTSEAFRTVDSPLAIALGHDVAGQAVVADLAKMPHLLIGGTTGSGKSVCIKSITACLICNNTPDDLRLVMIDPKMVELVRFNGLPHIYGEVEVDLERVVKVLRWVALEMDERYRRFADASARHLDDYNRRMTEQDKPVLPRVVALIDELADLMMLAPEAVEQLLCRIAQMGRATGIHLVVATQRPSTDVITGLIKANFPARIAFATASQVDSRVILDTQGAETLLGDGDMLYLAADASHPVRVQGCYVGSEELDRIMGFWRKETGPVEETSPWTQIIGPDRPVGDENDPYDPDYVDEEMLQRAISLVRERGTASASLLQRRLHVGYPRAARLMEVMTEMNIIGPPVAGGRRRDVLPESQDEDLPDAAS